MTRTLDNKTHATRPNRRGVVLMMTLLALVLLVGLIFYVYNLSQQVNARLALQQSADSAAISGSVWMARSMNQVAMNNVAQAKMLASVIVLDSLPLATDLSLNDAAAWAPALRRQTRNMPTFNSPREAALMRRGLSTLRDRMETQRDALRVMHGSIRDFPMDRLTFYASPGGGAPYGELWQAAAALSDLTRATVNGCGVLAQNNAVRWGRESGLNVRTAFLTPIRPILPVRAGEFGDLRDFRYPLGGRQVVLSNRAELTSDRPLYENSVEGGAIPDVMYPHRLGPWARLHKWRWEYFLTWGVPGSRSAEDSGPSGPGGSPQGGGQMQRGPTIGYTTRGPLHWALYYVWGWAGSMERWHWDGGRPDDGAEWGNGRHYRLDGELGVTPFTDYMWALGYAKLQYMLYDRTPRTIHRPEWETDYARARERALADPGKVHQVMFRYVWIESSVPPGDAVNWLRPGTFRANVPPPDDLDHLPEPLYVRNTAGRWAPEDVGWPDPERWGLAKVGSHIWRDDYFYETTGDPEIGISPKVDPLGQPLWQRVYVRSFYVWIGADFGQENVEIRNPCNWPAGRWPAIAPVLLATDPTADQGLGDYTPNPDTGYRRRFFTFLGAAQADTPPLIWRDAFGEAGPGRPVAYAQAKVFNTSSFDLWTQDWQAELTPVTRMEEWLDAMRSGANDATHTRGLLTPAAVMETHEAIRKLGETMVREQTRH